MSSVLQAQQPVVATSYRAVAARVGVVAFLAAAGLAAYAPSGDPHQESAVPFVLVMGFLVALVLFGYLVPRGLRAVQAGGPRAHRWAVYHAAAAFLGLALFWSGLPLLLAAAAGALGLAGRRQAPARGSTPRPYTVTVAIAAFVAVVTVAWTVIGNTVLPPS